MLLMVQLYSYLWAKARPVDVFNIFLVIKYETLYKTDHIIVQTGGIEQQAV